MSLFGWLFGYSKGERHSVKTGNKDDAEQDETYVDPEIIEYFTDESFEEYANRNIKKALETDYLGFAAIASAKAREAEKNGEHDKAWGLLHEVQTHYLNHAEENNFTIVQMLGLISPIHKTMANILRKEGKHLDAMSHIIYWAASNDRQLKEQDKKIPAYFRRLKYKHTTLEDVQAYIKSIKGKPDFHEIQQKLTEWC